MLRLVKYGWFVFVSMISTSALSLSQFNKNEIESATKVVFIYQNDPGDNFDYYYKAAQYYRQQKGFIIVTDLTSIEFMHQWLIDTAKLRQEPWREIDLVTHGSFLKGISLPVLEGNIRDKNHIMSFEGTDKLALLPYEVIDDRTQLNILACGVGRHKPTVNGLAAMFENINHQRPQVVASTGYQFFETDQNDPGKVIGFELEFYSALISKSVEWDVTTIAQMFREKYPESKIDWSAAIRNEVSYDAARPFSVKSRLELSALAYKDDLHRLGSVNKYVKKHPQLSAVLDSQLIIGPLKFEEESYSSELTRLKSEVFSLKIFYPGK